MNDVAQVVAAVEGPVSGGHAVDDLRGTVRVVVVELPAQQVHKTVDLLPPRDHAAQVAGTVYAEDRLVSVCTNDLPEFVRYAV